MVPSNIHTIGKNTSHAETKHAEYDIELKGNVLRVDGRGVVNEEILKQYHEDVKDIVISLKGQKWGFLGFVQGTGILTPAAGYSSAGPKSVRAGVLGSRYRLFLLC